MNRDFNEWFSSFKSSISNYAYYVDFDKIYKNVDKVKLELNILIRRKYKKIALS